MPKIAVEDRQTPYMLQHGNIENKNAFTPQTQQLQESSDIADTLKELNTDKLDNESFSSIDTKTRLISADISSIVTIDGLIALKFLPKEVSVITRSKKRLAVSLKGAGREEIVRIASGMLEQKNGSGALDRIKNIFGNRQ